MATIPLKKIIYIFTCIIAIPILYFVIGYTSFLNTSFSFSDEIISVESKGNFQEIFTSQGTNPFFTKVYFKLNPPEQLQVGKYQLNGEYSIESFLQAFQSPLNEDQQITILE